MKSCAHKVPTVHSLSLSKQVQIAKEENVFLKHYVPNRFKAAAMAEWLTALFFFITALNY